MPWVAHSFSDRRIGIIILVFTFRRCEKVRMSVCPNTSKWRPYEPRSHVYLQGGPKPLLPCVIVRSFATQTAYISLITELSKVSRLRILKFNGYIQRPSPRVIEVRRLGSGGRKSRLKLGGNHRPTESHEDSV